MPTSMHTDDHADEESAAMNMYFRIPADIEERQRVIRSEFRRSQRAISITGMRQLWGNTFIAIGERLHGAANRQRDTRSALPSAPALRPTI